MVSAGIIGCGAVTEDLYLKCLPAIEGLRVTALYDRDPARAEQLAAASGARAAGLDEVRACDVIYICTPPDSHFELVRGSLASGKIVVCEKPFVPSTEQALALCARAREIGARLHVAHFRRLYPAAALARELVPTLDFGALRRIRVVEGRRFNWQARSDYFLENPLGGVLLDTGSHAIDAALFIAGHDRGDLRIEAASGTTEKSEPSHYIRARVAYLHAGATQTLDLVLSRYETLANQITLDFERGRLIVPAALASYVVVQGPRGRTVVNARQTYPSNLEVFFAQHQRIAAGDTDTFRADLFINLTRILESVRNAVTVSEVRGVAL